MNTEILNPRRLSGEDIIEMDIADACEEYAKVYAANKNIARITPKLIDNLRPVQRRVLYDMYTQKCWGTKMKKTTTIAADTMGRFHPHGDGSIEQTIENMNKSWCWSIPMLTPGSSFGSIRGDEAAAGRYTETQLSPFSMDCYFDEFKLANMPMRDSYTAEKEDKEPDYLPAKYPVSLINPQLSGIGWGMASNIPPFNFSEVVKATIKLMKNPEEKIRLIPDSPTGCDIVDDGLFDELNATGKSKFKLRSSYEIDYMNNVIRITSLPINSTSAGVQRKLIELHKQGKFDELVDFEEKTKRGVVDFKIILTPNADPDKVIEKILRKDVGLQRSYSCELRFVHDFETKVYTPRQVLLLWLEYRRDCVRSIYNERIIRTMEKIHMNEVLLLMCDDANFKFAVENGMKSKTREEFKEKLQKKFDITTIQAETIAKMALSDSVKERREEFIRDKKRLEQELKDYEVILSTDEGVDEVIRAQLEEGIKKWGMPRRSKIIKVGKVKVPNTMHLIGISQDGFIKKLNLDEYVSIGAVGKSSQIFTITINNRDNLLLFDDKGMVTRLSVSALPDMKYKENGVRISRYFKTQGSIVSALPESDIKEHSDSNIVMVTEKGFGKKTPISKFGKVVSNTIAISLAEDDRLVAAIPSLNGDDFIVYTSFGDGIRLSTNDFKEYSRTAKGLSLLSLRRNETVLGIDLIYNDIKYLLYITSSGRLKITESKYFPTMKRKDEPITLINLKDGEILIGIHGVSKRDTLVAYRKKSEPVELDIKDIPVTTRVAEPKKLIKTPKGDEVIAYQVVKRSEEGQL